ncbi:MAG: hypothetical protein ACOY93_20615 [Bacillota bacterium]
MYNLREHGAPEEVPAPEHLLREGDRVVAVQDGKANAVWHIRPDGIWRADPRNGRTLLRYLPAELTDGLYWSQQSGDSVVWFRLAKVDNCLHQIPTCWEVVVLNRGERTVFRFAEGRGPVYAGADNWAEPARSFHKYLNDQRLPAPLPAEARTRLLQNLAQPPSPAPVVARTAEQFAEEAVYLTLKQARPNLEVLRLDLNGDGKPEFVVGRFGQWSTTQVAFYQADGSRIGSENSVEGTEYRVEQLHFKGMRRPAFLIQSRRTDGTGGGVTAVTARENEYMKSWTMEGVYGWGLKSSGTRADRVTWTEDGTITVEWDLKDPAGHTLVTVYTWFEDPKGQWSGVTRNSVTYRPEGKELLYPSTPQDVLQAAFVARWLGLSDELPRYFATPESAALFAAEKRISAPDYGPGSVQIGKVTTPKERQSCGAEVQQVEPEGPGPHTFGATWGGFEWCAGVWGTVTFATDRQGRAVIEAIRLEGAVAHGH